MLYKAAGLVNQLEVAISVVGDLVCVDYLIVGRWTIGRMVVGWYYVGLVAEWDSARCVRTVFLDAGTLDLISEEVLAGISEQVYLIFLVSSENRRSEHL